MTSIVDFPEDVLLKVFSYLNVTERVRLSAVCKRFHQTVSSPSAWPVIVWTPTAEGEGSSLCSLC
jgi:hypothetical protein